MSKLKVVKSRPPERVFTFHFKKSKTIKLMTVLEALTTSFSDQYLCPPVFVGKYKSLWFYFSVSLMGYSRSQYILIKVFFWGGEGRNPKVTWQDPLCQFIFNWRIIALQYCVGFCHTTWRIRHTHIHTHPPAWALSPLSSVSGISFSCFGFLVST